MYLELNIGDTVVDTVTGSSKSHDGVAPWTSVVIYATVDIHICKKATASASEFFLEAKTYFTYRLEPEENVSYIKAVGQSDGTIYLSEAS